MKEIVLKINNLSKTYDGSKNILENINLEFKKGELVTIIGSSGAGKSTFLRCINKMIESTGEILFNNEDVNKANKKELKNIRTKIGMIFQHYNVVQQLTAVENVLHGKLGQMSSIKGIFGLYSKKDILKAFKILRELGLGGNEHKKCGSLSGGQKQRVGIGRALIQNPSLILCDEPIASLDPQSAKVIMDILRDISTNKNITCIVNLHQVEVALEYSDRIIGLRHGKVIFDGTPAELTPDMIHKIYGAKDGDLIVDKKLDKAQVA